MNGFHAVSDFSLADRTVDGPNSQGFVLVVEQVAAVGKNDESV